MLVVVLLMPLYLSMVEGKAADNGGGGVADTAATGVAVAVAGAFDGGGIV